MSILHISRFGVNLNENLVQVKWFYIFYNWLEVLITRCGRKRRNSATASPNVSHSASGSASNKGHSGAKRAIPISNRAGSTRLLENATRADGSALCIAVR